MNKLDAYTLSSGATEVQIEHYDLDLDYKIRSNRLTGHAVLHGRVLAATSRLTLDLRNLKASRVLVNGTKVRFAQTRSKLTMRSHFEADEAIIIDVHYSGKPGPEIGTWGDVGWEELTDGVLVAGQPNGAATWFPCNDHPRHKATYSCTVLVDSNYTAICNGELQHKTRKGGRTAWAWKSTHPLATYLATVQIGQYRRGLIDHAHHPPARVPLRLACGNHLWQQAQDILAKQHAVMAVFEESFGQYPFDHYGVVVTDDALDIPLESQPLSILGSNHLAAGWATERLIVHELAHQWFGNSLTPHQWSDIWLNEGFACYAEWLWAQQSGQHGTESHARAAHAQLASLRQDIVLADPGAANMFDDRVYKRGALTLHALRSATGEDVFCRILRSWTEENRHGTVSTASFIAHAERIAAQPVKSLLRDWLFEPLLPAYPEVRSP